MPASVERWRQFAAVVLTMIALICSTVLPTSWTPAALGAHKDRSEAVRPQFGPGTSNNEGYGPLNDPPNLKPDSKAATHPEHPGVIEVTERARHRGLSGTHNVPPGKPGQLDAETLIARLPVHFVENRGQSPGAVRFEVKARRHKVFFTSNEVVFAAVSETAGKRTGEAIRLKFLGASANPVISGTEMLPGKFNYFIGNDPSKWKTDVPSFRGVAYNGLYKGVDLVFKDNHGQIERDFVIGPRVDPDVIRMRYQGAKNVRLSKDGELLVETLSSVLAESRPQAYQNIAGKRVEVAATFKICKDGNVGISVGRYDCSQQLIIDPIFRFSTFVGGSENDQALGLAVDATGVYAAGITTSLDFPSTGIFGPLGGFHEFALKLTPDGSSLIYSDVIGGSSDDFGFACQVHPSDGSLYFLGITNSSDSRRRWGLSTPRTTALRTITSRV